MQEPRTLLADLLRVLPPWLEPHAASVERVVRQPSANSVAEALNAARHDESVRFVDHSQLPADEAYESFIFRTGCVPTRDNLHDLFNGLVWLSFPRTKRRLNVLQSEQIERHGISGVRGTLRDALTLFDENAAILQAPADLAAALRRRDWRRLFITQRASWQSARTVLFGHALMEKLMQPRKAITAHVWLVDELTDEALSASLTPERLAAKDFLPLPVLGIPGWWPANEEPEFYEDERVFRPRR